MTHTAAFFAIRKTKKPHRTISESIPAEQEHKERKDCVLCCSNLQDSSQITPIHSDSYSVQLACHAQAGFAQQMIDELFVVILLGDIPQEGMAVPISGFLLHAKAFGSLSVAVHPPSSSLQAPSLQMQWSRGWCCEATALSISHSLDFRQASSQPQGQRRLLRCLEQQMSLWPLRALAW